jgi:hypothetical protein
MLLSWVYGFNWTYISAGTTISALIRVNFIDITFGNRFNGTLINTSSASGAIIINYVGHFKFFFDLALQS